MRLLARTVSLTVVVALIATAARSQEPPEKTAAEVLHEQASVIARSIVAQLSIGTGERVVVVVEGRGARILTENAFAAALVRSGAAPVVPSGARPQDALLRATILDQSIASVPMENGLFIRTARTVMESRLEHSDGSVRVVVPVEQVDVDTVRAAVQGRIEGDDVGEGIWDRLLTPVILIGGVVLLVYLLFTVRS